MAEARLKLYQGKTHTKPIVEDPSEQQQRGGVGCLRAYMHVHVGRRACSWSCRHAAPSPLTLCKRP